MMSKTVQSKSGQDGDPEKAMQDGQETALTHSLNRSEETELGSNGNTNGYIVSWELPTMEDLANPMDWNVGFKWTIIGLLSFLSFLVPLASSMMAPAVPTIMQEFSENSDQLGTFVVSVFVLGFAFGPLLIAPLSELYGRTIVYHVCNTLFILFTVGCALSNSMGMLIAFRFLAGFAGVAPITCGSGTIADLMPTDQRGRSMAIWSAGPILGPVVGPICGGFLVAAKDWRWIFWVIAIAGVAAIIPSLFIFRETYPPVLLERKAARLRKERNDSRYRSELQSLGSPKQVMLDAMVRPARMLLIYPIVTALCIYIALIYGIMYLLFTTFTFVYRDTYGFSADASGLSFIASGVGSCVGLLYVSLVSDRIIKKRRAMGKLVRPEDRFHIILTLPTTLALPIGLLIYGWTAQKRLHWIAPMIGTGITAMGMIGIFMCVQTYLVDAYTLHAASVTAANGVLRSLLGALLPLCGLSLYNAIGLGWANTMFACIILLFTPIPWAVFAFGERLRKGKKKSEVKNTQPEARQQS